MINGFRGVHMWRTCVPFPTFSLAGLDGRTSCQLGSKPSNNYHPLKMASRLLTRAHPICSHISHVSHPGLQRNRSSSSFPTRMPRTLPSLSLEGKASCDYLRWLGRNWSTSDRSAWSLVLLEDWAMSSVARSFNRMFMFLRCKPCKDPCQLQRMYLTGHPRLEGIWGQGRCCRIDFIIMRSVPSLSLSSISRYLSWRT